MRKLAKGVVWLLGACVFLIAAWFGINATDEALSDQARAALAVPPLPVPERNNGYLDHLVLDAPAGVPTYEAALERLKVLNNQAGELPPPAWGEYRRDKRIPHCEFGAIAGEKSEAPPCFETALLPQVRNAIDENAVLLDRYRAMRDKPHFINLFEPKSPEDHFPAYMTMLDAGRMILFRAAQRYQRGDRRGAVRELERETAFYRRMAADATTLIDKMIAFAALDRVALFAADLARRGPLGDVAFWRELERAVRPLTKEEGDLALSLRREVAMSAQWMQSRRHVRMSDAAWQSLATYSDRRRPWWDTVAPYLYRPHQTVNWYAARCAVFAGLSDVPGNELFRARDAVHERARKLDPGPVARVIFNPVGWDHPQYGGACEMSDYIARSHSVAGVQTLARLVVKLRAAGISKPEELAKALAGPLGPAHPDPFTGQPMRFDPANGTIGFDAETRHLTGVSRALRARYGRMALRP